MRNWPLKSEFLATLRLLYTDGGKGKRWENVKTQSNGAICSTQKSISHWVSRSSSLHRSQNVSTYSLFFSNVFGNRWKKRPKTGPNCRWKQKRCQFIYLCRTTKLFSRFFFISFASFYFSTPRSISFPHFFSSLFLFQHDLHGLKMRAKWCFLVHALVFVSGVVHCSISFFSLFVFDTCTSLCVYM